MNKFAAWLIGGLAGVAILLSLPCLSCVVILVLQASGPLSEAAAGGIVLVGILISLVVGIGIAVLIARRLEKLPTPPQLTREVQFPCAHCAVTVAVPASLAGSSVVCGGCQHELQVPLTAITNASNVSPPIARWQFVAIAVLSLVILGAGAFWGAIIRSAYADFERDAQTTVRMKRIVLALHDYHKQHGEFPPAIVRDPEGRPLYSWRVLILPHLGEHEIASRFHYHEAWDSPHNKLLLNSMPQVFRSEFEPASSPARNTSFLLMSGAGTLFSESSQRQESHLYDGAANTACLVEVLWSGVAWTEPVDMDFAALLRGGQSLDSDPVVLNSWSRIARIAMFDGSVVVAAAGTTELDWILICRPDDSVALEHQP